MLLYNYENVISATNICFCQVVQYSHGCSTPAYTVFQSEKSQSFFKCMLSLFGKLRIVLLATTGEPAAVDSLLERTETRVNAVM